MALQSTLLSNVAANIFTSNGSSVVTAMYICNTGNSSVHFNIFAVPSGMMPAANTAIYYRVPLTSYDTYVIDTEKLMFENGDQLYANITENMDPNISVVATVSSIGI
jgi:hypothetical protein